MVNGTTCRMHVHGSGKSVLRLGDNVAVGVVLQLDGSSLLVGRKGRDGGHMEAASTGWLVLQHCWSLLRFYCGCARQLGDGLAAMGPQRHGYCTAVGARGVGEGWVRK